MARQKTFDATWAEKWWAWKILSCGESVLDDMFHEVKGEDLEGNEYTYTDVRATLQNILGRDPTPSEEHRFEQACQSVCDRLRAYVRRMPEGNGSA